MGAGETRPLPLSKGVLSGVHSGNSASPFHSLLSGGGCYCHYKLVHATLVPMPAYVIYGDSFLVSRRMKRLEAESGASQLLESNRLRFMADQVKLPELIGVANTIPFLDSRRLIVVEGLLALAEPRTGRGRSRGASLRTEDGHGGKDARWSGWDGLPRGLSGIPDTTVLIFVDGAIRGNNPLLNLLRPVAQITALIAPLGEALARWIKIVCQEKGASISPAAIGSLVDLVGSDLWTLDQELEKLSLFAAGGTIDEVDVKEMVAQVREANIFAAVDAMLEGKAGIAFTLLLQLRQDGREVSNIIAMVQRQLRLLALARDLSEQGVSSRELGGRLGISTPFVLVKTLERARRHTSEAISWRYQKLLDADLAMKTGLLEPDLALELLVGELVT